MGACRCVEGLVDLNWIPKDHHVELATMAHNLVSGMFAAGQSGAAAGGIDIFSILGTEKSITGIAFLSLHW